MLRFWQFFDIGGRWFCRLEGMLGWWRIGFCWVLIAEWRLFGGLVKFLRDDKILEWGNGN